ncbi:MAG: T9SS C-terminal target domain-containing protein [Hymenobacteraceae bacterium]|nr:T9SS C-terminal target domain-containing protein [Hymenobacteraceae bacterium]
MNVSFRRLLMLAGLSVAFTACKKDDDTAVLPTGPKSVVELPAGNLATRTLTADKIYLLKGAVYVPDGATLTIEAGTIIKGDRATNGSLVVRQGGTLLANGTAEKPVIFTSNQAVGSRGAGDWGGVVITGRAPVNFTSGTGTVEGYDTPIAYGGANPNDNSGSLTYVRIEFAGIALTPGNEINGLTLAGVGAGTKLEHIQVIYSGDDAFEFFGGTVNAKYLVAARTTDDMFDTDNGFSGKVQYAFGLSDPNLSDPAGASNGFESDNDANGTTNAPQTSGAFANVTILGPQATTGATLPGGGNKYGSAAHLRRNSALSLYNTVLAGWPKGLLIDGSAAENNFANGALKVQGVVVSGMPTGKALNVSGGNSTANPPVPPSTFDIAQYYNAAANKNELLTDNSALQLNANAFTLTAPNVLPGAGSPLLDASKVAPLPAGFEAAPFRGAFGTTNWLAGWTNFDPQNTAY